MTPAVVIRAMMEHVKTHGGHMPRFGCVSPTEWDALYADLVEMADTPPPATSVDYVMVGGIPIFRGGPDTDGLRFADSFRALGVR